MPRKPPKYDYVGLRKLRMAPPVAYVLGTMYRNKEPTSERDMWSSYGPLVNQFEAMGIVYRCNYGDNLLAMEPVATELFQLGDVALFLNELDIKERRKPPAFRFKSEMRPLLREISNQIWFFRELP